jgi:carboxyl-terminal processing protease
VENKFVRCSVIAVVVVILLAGTFAGGFATGYLSKQAGATAPLIGQPASPAPGTDTTPADGNSATPENLQTLFKPFWQSWDIIHENYVDQPVDDTKLMQGAIRGMIESLGDQHSSYMDPYQFEQASMQIEGEYDGIGAWVDTTGDFLTIVSPMPDSPAEKAGLKPGDQFIKIDGEDMTGVPGEVALQKVLGKAGTTVHLTVMREGESKPLEFDIVRAHIVVPSVESKMLDNGIGYLQIYTFGDNTDKEVHDALEKLMKENPKGLIIDLRNNGGGYLDTAVNIASEFIPEGTVLIEQFGDGKRNVYEAKPGGIATKIPIVVLINEGSASASEILAGALQDYGRAKLVGAQSYGKGSVQYWIPLDDNQGAVRITIAKWLTPKERTIHKIGLTPDVVVEMTEDDYKAKRDPQLDKAIEVVLQMINGQ